MDDSPVIDFSAGNFVHLGLGGTMPKLPRHDGDMAWYEKYGELHGSDGKEGRLVSMYTQTESWDVWEVHPHGHELVLCVDGEITLLQEFPDGTTQRATITAGQGVINDPGVWHTADIADGKQATVLFITAGEGTDHRPR